ncbi:MAG: hypothetical protein LBL71_01260 [Endomicrobium sp.]|jgi:hypothetical protein|nr:hypothetical protein [Endomicrobium sp.]
MFKKIFAVILAVLTVSPLHAIKLNVLYEYKGYKDERGGIVWKKYKYGPTIVDVPDYFILMLPSPEDHIEFPGDEKSIWAIDYFNFKTREYGNEKLHNFPRTDETNGDSTKYFVVDIPDDDYTMYWVVLGHMFSIITKNMMKAGFMNILNMEIDANPEDVRKEVIEMDPVIRAEFNEAKCYYYRVNNAMVTKPFSEIPCFSTSLKRAGITEIWGVKKCVEKAMNGGGTIYSRILGLNFIHDVKARRLAAQITFTVLNAMKGLHKLKPLDCSVKSYHEIVLPPVTRSEILLNIGTEYESYTNSDGRLDWRIHEYGGNLWSKDVQCRLFCLPRPGVGMWVHKRDDGNNEEFSTSSDDFRLEDGTRALEYFDFRIFKYVNVVQRHYPYEDSGADDPDKYYFLRVQRDHIHPSFLYEILRQQFYLAVKDRIQDLADRMNESIDSKTERVIREAYKTDSGLKKDLSSMIFKYTRKKREKFECGRGISIAEMFSLKMFLDELEHLVPYANFRHDRVKSSGKLDIESYDRVEWVELYPDRRVAFNLWLNFGFLDEDKLHKLSVRHYAERGKVLLDVVNEYECYKNADGKLDWREHRYCECFSHDFAGRYYSLLLPKPEKWFHKRDDGKYEKLPAGPRVLEEGTWAVEYYDFRIREYVDIKQRTCVRKYYELADSDKFCFLNIPFRDFSDEFISGILEKRFEAVFTDQSFDSFIVRLNGKIGSSPEYVRREAAEINPELERYFERAFKRKLSAVELWSLKMLVGKLEAEVVDIDFQHSEGYGYPDRRLLVKLCSKCRTLDKLNGLWHSGSHVAAVCDSAFLTFLQRLRSATKLTCISVDDEGGIECPRVIHGKILLGVSGRVLNERGEDMSDAEPKFDHQDGRGPVCITFDIRNDKEKDEVLNFLKANCNHNHRADDELRILKQFFIPGRILLTIGDDYETRADTLSDFQTRTLFVRADKKLIKLCWYRHIYGDSLCGEAACCLPFSLPSPELWFPVGLPVDKLDAKEQKTGVLAIDYFDFKTSRYTADKQRTCLHGGCGDDRYHFLSIARCSCEPYFLEQWLRRRFKAAMVRLNSRFDSHAEGFQALKDYMNNYIDRKYQEVTLKVSLMDSSLKADLTRAVKYVADDTPRTLRCIDLGKARLSHIANHDLNDVELWALNFLMDGIKKEVPDADFHHKPEVDGNYPDIYVLANLVLNAKILEGLHKGADHRRPHGFRAEGLSILGDDHPSGNDESREAPADDDSEILLYIVSEYRSSKNSRGVIEWQLYDYIQHYLQCSKYCKKLRMIKFQLPSFRLPKPHEWFHDGSHNGVTAVFPSGINEEEGIWAVEYFDFEKSRYMDTKQRDCPHEYEDIAACEPGKYYALSVRRNSFSPSRLGKILKEKFDSVMSNGIYLNGLIGEMKEKLDAGEDVKREVAEMDPELKKDFCRAADSDLSIFELWSFKFTLDYVKQKIPDADFQHKFGEMYPDKSLVFSKLRPYLFDLAYPVCGLQYRQYPSCTTLKEPGSVVPPVFGHGQILVAVQSEYERYKSRDGELMWRRHIYGGNLYGRAVCTAYTFAFDGKPHDELRSVEEGDWAIEYFDFKKDRYMDTKQRICPRENSETNDPDKYYFLVIERDKFGVDDLKKLLEAKFITALEQIRDENFLCKIIVERFGGRPERMRTEVERMDPELKKDLDRTVKDVLRERETKGGTLHLGCESLEEALAFDKMWGYSVLVNELAKRVPDADFHTPKRMESKPSDLHIAIDIILSMGFLNDLWKDNGGEQEGLVQGQAPAVGANGAGGSAQALQGNQPGQEGIVQGQAPTGGAAGTGISVSHGPQVNRIERHVCNKGFWADNNCFKLLVPFFAGLVIVYKIQYYKNMIEKNALELEEEIRSNERKGLLNRLFRWTGWIKGEKKAKYIKNGVYKSISELKISESV